MGFISRLLGHRPVQPAQQPQEQAVEANPGTNSSAVEQTSAVGQIAAGNADVPGRSAGAHLGVPTDSTPAPHGGNTTVFATALAERSADAGLPRPKREDFDSDQSFRSAYLQYQDANMAVLKDQYPRAYYGGPVWYGTHLKPEQVLKEGIFPKEGANFDIQDHQRDFKRYDQPEQGSALRGSCTDCRVPAGIAGDGGYVYMLEPRGGTIALGQALGEDDLIPAEQEYAFGSCQPPEAIKAWREVGDYSEVHGSFRLGPQQDNPDYKPPE